MFSARNVEKFLKDHPRFSLMEGNIIATQAYGEMNKKGFLFNHQAYELFGSGVGRLFLREIEKSEQHLIIIMEDGLASEENQDESQ